MNLTQAIKRSLKRWHREHKALKEDHCGAWSPCKATHRGPLGDEMGCTALVNEWNPYYSENNICIDCELYELINTEVEYENQSNQSGAV